MLSLTLTRVAVHGETNKTVAQKIWDEQKNRQYMPGQPYDPTKIPENEREATCDVTAVYSNDAARLEITTRNWSEVGDLKDTITLSIA